MTGDISPPATPSEISIQLVPTEKILDVTRNPDLRLDPAFLASAIERRDSLFGAFDGDKLVSYVWRTETAAPHTRRLWVSVNRPYCYCYNSFTLPEYRGKAISPAVHLFSDRAMAEKGYTHRAGFVLLSNLASLAMGKRMGSVPIGHAGYLKIFRRYFYFRTKAVRDIGFRFYEPGGNQAD